MQHAALSSGKTKNQNQNQKSCYGNKMTVSHFLNNAVWMWSVTRTVIRAIRDRIRLQIGFLGRVVLVLWAPVYQWREFSGGVRSISAKETYPGAWGLSSTLSTESELEYSVNSAGQKVTFHSMTNHVSMEGLNQSNSIFGHFTTSRTKNDNNSCIRLINKSWRISYRKLIVNNIRKAVFFSQLCTVHFF